MLKLKGNSIFKSVERVSVGIKRETRAGITDKEKLFKRYYDSCNEKHSHTICDISKEAPRKDRYDFVFKKERCLRCIRKGYAVDESLQSGVVTKGFKGYTPHR